MKYQPRGWKLCPYDAADKVIVLDGETEARNIVAKIYHDDCNLEEQEAYACIIVAAPDLLQACKSALRFVQDTREWRPEGEEWHEKEGCLPFNTCYYHDMDDLMNELEAAIAKAEGKEAL